MRCRGTVHVEEEGLALKRGGAWCREDMRCRGTVLVEEEGLVFKRKGGGLPNA